MKQSKQQTYQTFLVVISSETHRRALEAITSNLYAPGPHSLAKSSTSKYMYVDRTGASYDQKSQNGHPMLYGFIRFYNTAKAVPKRPGTKIFVSSKHLPEILEALFQNEPFWETDANGWDATTTTSMGIKVGCKIFTKDQADFMFKKIHELIKRCKKDYLDEMVQVPGGPKILVSVDWSRDRKDHIVYFGHDGPINLKTINRLNKWRYSNHKGEK